MIVRPTTTTITASTTSRAATSAPLSHRKTSPPPTTSAAPAPAAPSDGRASRSRRGRRARRPARGPRRPTSAALGLAPDQRAAAGGEDERPDDGVADPQPPLPQQQQRGEQQADEPGGDHPALAPARDAGDQRPRARGIRRPRRQQRPGEGVQRDPQAAGEGGDHEGEPHQPRVQPEPRPEARAHAADHGGRAVAAERCGLRVGHGHHGDVPTAQRRFRAGPASPHASRMPPTAARIAGSM